ncbi:AsmA-like C-terminal domain-containing protein [Paenibacillus lactis]|uniref:Uncharacterized protein n=1 Tax=Paenibacillus haidiansis TaxID=1574488 RepID=A0ABU7W064_9BACL
MWGKLVMRVLPDQQIQGTIRFRGTPIPIEGSWNESAQQIMFHSPYAAYSGHLSIYDDVQIQLRHLVLTGRLQMLPPSLQAGEYGTWVATTDISLPEYSGYVPPQPSSTSLPPVGVFVTSNILYGNSRL